MSHISRTIDDIDYADARTFENLAMIPLVLGHGRDAGYLTLDEALATGRFRVTEVSESGQVPELRVRNDLAAPVLLLDGEELVGAKQNRVVNLTILVPAQTELTIPVSCVEAGRWRHETSHFAASGRTQFREGRAAKLAQVSASLAVHSRATADQGDVWDRINERAAALGADAPTRAMHDVYESRRANVDSFIAALPAADGQAGAAFAINGDFVGIELFDAPATLARLLPKIISSYALDAVVAAEAPRAAAAGENRPRRPARAAHGLDAASVRAWLNGVATSEPRVHTTVGLGDTLRWHARGVVAAALVVDDRLVHFVGFPVDHAEQGGPRRSTMRAASRRRREHSQD